MNKKKKLIVFKPIDAYDKIDKFWDFSGTNLSRVYGGKK
jgi:hypothetical protein